MKDFEFGDDLTLFAGVDGQQDTLDCHHHAARSMPGSKENRIITMRENIGKGHILF